jgi:hypothetical protein
VVQCNFEIVVTCEDDCKRGCFFKENLMFI